MIRIDVKRDQNGNANVMMLKCVGNNYAEEFRALIARLGFEHINYTVTLQDRYIDIPLKVNGARQFESIEDLEAKCFGSRCSRLNGMPSHNDREKFTVFINQPGYAYDQVIEGLAVEIEGILQESDMSLSSKELKMHSVRDEIALQFLTYARAVEKSMKSNVVSPVSFHKPVEDRRLAEERKISVTMPGR